MKTKQLTVVLEAMYDPHAEVQWLSLTGLLWSFQLHSGCRGVLSTGNHCTWKLDDLRNEYDGQQAIRSFGKYIVHLFKRSFLTLRRKQTAFQFSLSDVDDVSSDTI